MDSAMPLLGNRLTVGRQTLDLLVVVRIHVPQPKPMTDRTFQFEVDL